MGKVEQPIIEMLDLLLRVLARAFIIIAVAMVWADHSTNIYLNFVIGLSLIWYYIGVSISALRRDRKKWISK